MIPPTPVTITHAENPELPPGCSYTFLSGEPNAHGYAVLMASIENGMLERRIRENPVPGETVASGEAE